jgi:PKD repeat protein
VGRWGAEAHFAAQQLGPTVQFVQQSLDAQSYEWDFGDGATSTSASPLHTYTANGLYTVVLKALGCTTEDTSTAVVTVTGLGLDREEYSLKVFPNPGSDRVFWDPQSGYVDVLDECGRRVAQWPAEAGEANTFFLRPGVYGLRTDDGRVQRWVKEPGAR